MSNCAKFRENQTKTVGGVTIWRHTSRQTDKHQRCKQQQSHIDCITTDAYQHQCCDSVLLSAVLCFFNHSLFDLQR